MKGGLLEAGSLKGTYSEKVKKTGIMLEDMLKNLKDNSKFKPSVEFSDDYNEKKTQLQTVMENLIIEKQLIFNITRPSIAVESKILTFENSKTFLDFIPNPNKKRVKLTLVYRSTRDGLNS